MTHWMTTDAFRVAVEHFNDGWGWHAWETLTAQGWQPLFSPTIDNTRRRFRTHEQACEFFLLLAEIIVGSDTESTKAAPFPARTAASSTPHSQR